MAPWADALYATDFRWWLRYGGVPEFKGLKICQDPKVAYRREWGIQCVEVNRRRDEIILYPTATIGWGGNSGFGGLNIVVQTGANPIILVGYDMRLDKGLHWHGSHGRGLSNPVQRNVERWRRAIDSAAESLRNLGIVVINASPVSTLTEYPKMDLIEALSAGVSDAEDHANTGSGTSSVCAV